MKRNGHSYRAAESTADVGIPPSHEVVWMAFDRETRKRIGPIRAARAFDAARDAAVLYQVDLETVHIERLFART